MPDQPSSLTAITIIIIHIPLRTIVTRQMLTSLRGEPKLAKGTDGVQLALAVSELTASHKSVYCAYAMYLLALTFDC